MFRINVFGGLQLLGPEGVVGGRAAQRHRLGLLALLADAHPGGMGRERLVATLWPDAAPERSGRLLSDSLYRIHQVVPGAVRTVGTELALDPDHLESDLVEYREALGEGDLARAVQLYRGPFLDGFHVPSAVEFEHWCDTTRTALHRQHVQCLEQLAEATSDPVQRSGWLSRAAAHDPYSSRVALAFMESLVEQGDPAGALLHAEAHERRVREELGLGVPEELAAFVARLRDEASSTTLRRPEPPPRVASGTRARTEPSGDAVPSTTSDVANPAAPRPATTGSTRAPATGPSTAAGTRHTRPGRPAAAWIGAGTAVLVLGGVLWWTAQTPASSSGAPPDPQRLAVLPFESLTPGDSADYLADGLTEELIGRLSGLEGLAVVGRTSVFALSREGLDAQGIGQRLGVGAFVDGSVRRSADRLRIAVQLVDAGTGVERWSRTFERPMSDVFAIQDEIARAVVLELTGDPTLREGPAARFGVEAFNLYLRGRYEWHRRTEVSLLAARDLFDRATELAPEFAQAHTGKGDALAVLGFYDYLPPHEAFPEAQRAAERALDLDPLLAEPHATLGYVALYYAWDGPLAEQRFQRALELDPGYSTGHQWYANLLVALDRTDEAAAAMRAALERDPLSRIANAALGYALLYGDRYEQAVAQLDHVLTLDPDFELAHLWRGYALEALGEFEQAEQSIRRSVTLSAGSALSRAALARTRALRGDVEEARALLEELEAPDADYVPAFEVAKVHEALGDQDATFRWLERAWEERSHSMVFLEVDPQLIRMRDLPRFQELVARVDLRRSGGESDAAVGR